MEKNQNQKVDDIVAKIKELVQKGNISRIIIKKQENTILNVPLTAGILGIALAPWAMIVATLVTIGTDCEIKLETTDNSTIDIDPNDIEKTDDK